MTWCFKKFPQGLLFHEIFEHAIKRTPCSISTNIRPYRYPYDQMREIESMPQYILDARIIQLVQSALSTPLSILLSSFTPISTYSPFLFSHLFNQGSYMCVCVCVCGEDFVLKICYSCIDQCKNTKKGFSHSL